MNDKYLETILDEELPILINNGISTKTWLIAKNLAKEKKMKIGEYISYLINFAAITKEGDFKIIGATKDIWEDSIFGSEK